MTSLEDGEEDSSLRGKTGEYVSLGYYEKDDLVSVVEYLRDTGSVSRIGLWGRRFAIVHFCCNLFLFSLFFFSTSMGAATAIMYGATDPSIACMVLDSPFSSLTKIAKELTENSPVIKGRVEQRCNSATLTFSTLQR